jgi:hypothetical protein
MVTTGTIDLVERTYEGMMHLSICTCKHQKRQVVILFADKIVLAEHLEGHRTSTDAGLEIKHPNQVRNRKWLQLDTNYTGSSD